MANEFKVKKGLIVDGSGGTILDVQGSVGQLFSVTDSLTGDLFAVSDISGIPILNVNSSGAVDIDGTLAITDDVTLSSFGAGYLKTNVNGVISNTATIPWSTVSSTPTTISGYGITDALAIGTTSTTAMAGNTSLFDGAYSSLSGIPSTFAPSSHTHGIGGVTDASRWWNNFGDNHTTRTGFDAASGALTTGFGWRYVQGSGNGPGTSTSPNQYYALTVGLGNDYSYDNYAMQLAIPRNTSSPYISVRFEESASLGSWQKISAGYADSAGSVTWANVSGKPTNAIIDWTADQGSTNIHSGNYTDTDTWIANSATAAGYVASGANQANKVWKTDANGNPSWDDDRDTVYTHPTSAGNKHIPTGGSAGQFLKYSASGTATWATPSYTTNTNTTYSAGGGLDLTGTTFSIEADLRDGITKVGKDGSNYIAIDADDNNCIDFYISGDWVARMEADGDLHMKGDVIAFSGIFNP
jgi:hypothetical protein